MGCASVRKRLRTESGTDRRKDCWKNMAVRRLRTFCFFWLVWKEGFSEEKNKTKKRPVRKPHRPHILSAIIVETAEQRGARTASSQRGRQSAVSDSWFNPPYPEGYRYHSMYCRSYTLPSSSHSPRGPSEYVRCRSTFFHFKDSHAFFIRFAHHAGGV